MNAQHFLALFLLSTLAASTAAAQTSRGVNPCAEARRIAESPACLADAADCQAAQRWRQVFGPPGAGPADPQLTGSPDSRFAGKEIRLQATEELRSVLARLSAAAGLELHLDSRVTGEFETGPGTLPLGEAWHQVMGKAGLVALFQDGRVIVAQDFRDGDPRRQRIVTGFNCPTH